MSDHPAYELAQDLGVEFWNLFKNIKLTGKGLGMKKIDEIRLNLNKLAEDFIYLSIVGFDVELETIAKINNIADNLFKDNIITEAKFQEVIKVASKYAVLRTANYKEIMNELWQSSALKFDI